MSIPGVDIRDIGERTTVTLELEITFRAQGRGDMPAKTVRTICQHIAESLDIHPDDVVITDQLTINEISSQVN